VYIVIIKDSVTQCLFSVSTYFLFSFREFFFFWRHWGLNLGPHTCRQVLLPLEPLQQTLFVMGVFKIRASELFAWSWLWTLILLSPAFWVARITGMSHWCPAREWILNVRCMDRVQGSLNLERENNYILFLLSSKWFSISLVLTIDHKLQKYYQYI
jgi:hypothetical protein